MKSFRGIGASDGIVLGRAHVWRKRTPVLRRQSNPDVDPHRERQRLAQALDITSLELTALRAQLRERLGPEHASMLDAQILLLEDEEFLEQVHELIDRGRVNAEVAFTRAMAAALMPLDAAADSLFRERIVDFRDLEQRVLRSLVGGEDRVPQLPGPRIIVARQLSPSETAALDVDKILGFCIEEGGLTSHTSIIARSLGVPAVVGARGLVSQIQDEDELAVDGSGGAVHVDPSAEVVSRFEARIRRWRGVEERLQSLRDQSAETPDGHRLELFANVELPVEVDLAVRHGAEGIGLVRTEYFYFQSSRLPGEDEQFRAYADVIKRAAGRPVTFRVLDVGGDKLLSALGAYREENPFLGWRGVRFLLSNRPILKGQLRALYRASAEGPIRIMFPMITGLEELRTLREQCEVCQQELRDEGVALDENVPLGIMIETPSAVSMAVELAQECDFFSIGSNDLTQYILAVDRTNSRVQYLYCSQHPAVLRAVRHTIEAAHAAGISVSLCGEMASQPLQAVLLLGLGMDQISVNAAAVPLIKKVIRTVSFANAAEWSAEALRLSTAEEVEGYLRQRAHERLRDFLHV